MDLRILGIIAAALAIAGGYWLASQSSPTAAQMEVQASNPHSTESTMVPMSGTNSGGMGMMGSMMEMQMGQRMRMMQQMQACQQMMGGMGMMGQAAQAAPAGSLTEAEFTRASSEAGITVAATFMNPSMKPEEAGNKLVFKIALDTHSGDLLQYDLTQLAVIRNSEGLTVDEGFTWESQSESGHHRLGLLKVGAMADGKPLIAEDTTFIELELKGIGVSSRLFKWEEPFLGQSE